MFGTRQVPAVGISLGIERVFAIMEQIQKDKNQVIIAKKAYLSCFEIDLGSFHHFQLVEHQIYRQISVSCLWHLEHFLRLDETVHIIQYGNEVVKLIRQQTYSRLDECP